MTSPSHTPVGPLASAEHSSGVREAEAVQALSQLQRQTPTVSSAEDTPLSSVPHSPSPQLSLPYGFPNSPGSSRASLSSANSLPTSPPFPAPAGGYNFRRGAPGPLRDPSITGPHTQELPSRSTKRSASSTELRSPKSRCDSQGSQQPSNLPTSSIGAQSTPNIYHPTPKPASSRARATASAGSRTPTNAHEPQAGRRLAGRARKNPPHLADYRSTTGARVDDDGDVAMSMVSPFQNTFRVLAPLEVRSAGPHSSLAYREQAGASPLNDPRLPLSSQGSPFFGPRSAYPRPHPGSFTAHDVPTLHSPSPSSTPYTPGPPAKLTSSSGSFGLPHGIPGIPILPPPYQILPTPSASASHDSVLFNSAKVDGYLTIRNAIPVALVREVVKIMGKNLSVKMMLETAQIYSTPIQAYVVRDAFVTNWSHALKPFYDLMGKAVPKMPKTITVGSFKESDPTDVRQSILHSGSKDELYVYIALTSLSPENGFHTFLEGSHQAKHPRHTAVNDWIQSSIALQEGDALILRGDVSYLLSSNGGGNWISMTFEWGPGMIDLTKE